MYAPHPFRQPEARKRKAISQKRRARAERERRRPEAAVTVGMRFMRVHDSLHGDEFEPSSTGLTGTVTAFQFDDPARPQIVYDGDKDAVPTYADLCEVRAI